MMTIVEKVGLINGVKTLDTACFDTKEEAIEAVKSMVKDFTDAGFGTETSKDRENAIHVWDDDVNDFSVIVYTTEPYELAPYIVSNTYAYPEEDGVYLEILHDYMRMELSIYVYIPDYPEVKDNILNMSIEEGDIQDQTAIAMVSPDLREIVSGILEACQEEDEDDIPDEEDADDESDADSGSSGS